MEFLIFGTFWFWSLAITAWILITISEELGYYFRAGFVLLGFIGLYYFLGGEQPAHLLIGALYNPLQTVLAILGYFVAGTLWGIIKWFFFVLRERDNILNALRDKHYPRPENISLPKASYHKDRIITWMIYWPFSMLWTLINDPVRRGFEWIYRRIGKLMQSISERVFRGVFKEVERLVSEREAEAERKKKERLNNSFPTEYE